MKTSTAVCMVLCTVFLGFLCTVAGAEDIRLNDCEIRGADSFGDVHHMFRWPPGEGGPIAFAWGQFEHDGDEFCHVTSNTFSAQIEYWALTPKAYLETKIYYASGSEDSKIYELTPHPIPDENWRTMTRAFYSIKDVEDIALPFPAAGVHFRLRENCGTKSVIRENGSSATVTIGDSDARFRVVSIGFDYGNWAANWQGMDFHPGDAQDNFDNFTLEHDRSTDYVEFVTQEGGQCTIQAYCRKKRGEDCKVRVKVNGTVKIEKDLSSISDTDFSWADLWTGELSGGDTIRLENDEWTESSWFGLFQELHKSCVEFSNESRYGPAFRVVPVGGGGGNPPPPPPPPPADTTPPVLSSIAVAPVTHQAARIYFDCNEPVRWHAEYGTTTDYWGTSPIRDFDDPQDVYLTGLQPTTTYHFRIVATDRAGNRTTSADMTFTTKATPDTTAPIITNVQATATHNSITVTWTTNEPANSMLHYGQTAATTTWTGLPDFVTQHSVTATGLTPNKSYTYWVRSADASGNVGESPHLTVSTTAPPDTTAPRILSSSLRDVDQNQATVTWRTNEPASSVVVYGTTTAYGLEASAPGLTQEHQVVLPRLQADHLYYYEIRTADAAGNVTTEVGTVHTLPPDEGTISGKVKRYGQSGVYLSGATVSIKGLAGFSRTTDADGSFTLTGVPIGQYTLQCTASGYRAETSSVVVRRGQVSVRDFSLKPVGTIYGYVTAPASVVATKRPPLTSGLVGLNGAHVSLLPGNLTAVTQRGCLDKSEGQREGYFAFAQVPLGSYTLKVTADGCVPQTVSVTLANPGQVVRQDVNLTAAVYDLSVSDADLRVTSNPAATGQRVTVTCTVRNLGNVDMPNVTVRFRWGDTTLGDSTLPYPIAPGASRLAALSFTVPATATGSRPLVAIVDPDHTVREVREDNNTATLTWTVLQNKPDLVVRAEDISHTPEAPAPGATLTVRATVRNVGPAPAGAFRVGLLHGTTTLATTTKSSLSAGSSSSVSLTWTFPAGTTEPIDLTVVVDSEGAVDEGDETNNRATHTVGPGKPDLAVAATDITHSPTEPVAGTDVRFTIKVRNVGAAKALNALLRLIGPTGTLGEETISTLSAGYTSTRYITWSIPAIQHGTVTLTVVVDPDNVISEANEANNTAAHTLTILQRQIDLAIAAADITHSPATPQANHTVNITAKVHNAGNVKATGVKVRFFNGTQQIGEKTISSINAGDDASTTLSWKVPAGTTGTLSIRVQVDPAGEILETDETNNQATHTVPVGG